MKDSGREASTEALFTRFHPARIYAWLGGLSLFLLVFLVPPFQVPDEPQHFFRSYQLSKLEVWSRVQNGVVGSDLPASLPELVLHFMGTTEPHTRRVVPTQRLMATLGEINRPLDSGRTTFVDMSGIQSYAPLPYIPQAVAIAAGRAVGVGPLGLMYMGRFANALVAALVTALAISLFKVGRTFALLVALLPMTQFMTASVSPDALTIASALLFTAIMSRFLTDGEWFSRRRMAAFVSGLVMCIIKVVYLPLLFAGLGALMGMAKFSSGKTRRIIYWQLAAAGLTVALIVLWYRSITAGGGGAGLDGVNADGQMAYLAQDLFRALRIVVRSVYVRAEFLGKSTVGLLGWLNVPLATWVYVAIAIAFPLSACAEPRAARLGVWAAAWLLLVAIAVVPPIELALYLSWTPVGAYAAVGVQGRYFIPALPMLGVAVAGLLAHRVPSSFSILAYLYLVAILAAATAAMHLTVMRSYGLF